MWCSFPVVVEIMAEPNRLTAAVQLGPVPRHVCSLDDGVDLRIRWLGSRNSNAAADNDLGVTDRDDLAGGLPDDSVGKLTEAVWIVLAEPSHNELISSDTRDD